LNSYLIPEIGHLIAPLAMSVPKPQFYGSNTNIKCVDVCRSNFYGICAYSTKLDIATTLSDTLNEDSFLITAISIALKNFGNSWLRIGQLGLRCGCDE
jgi:hypothetical protein